jgi:hypothetical protein
MQVVIVIVGIVWRSEDTGFASQRVAATCYNYQFLTFKNEFNFCCLFIPGDFVVGTGTGKAWKVALKPDETEELSVLKVTKTTFDLDCTQSKFTPLYCASNSFASDGPSYT